MSKKKNHREHCLPSVFYKASHAAASLNHGFKTARCRGLFFFFFFFLEPDVEAQANGQLLIKTESEKMSRSRSSSSSTWQSELYFFFLLLTNPEKTQWCNHTAAAGARPLGGINSVVSDIKNATPGENGPPRSWRPGGLCHVRWAYEHGLPFVAHHFF